MPPKRTNALKTLNAGKGAKKKLGKVAIDTDEITKDLIEKESKITVLKVWAKKMQIPHLQEYKSQAINRLKVEMIRQLDEIEKNRIFTIQGTEHIEEYTAIENYLKKFAKNESASVYGEAGKEFIRGWETLTDNEKIIFTNEYLELISAKNNSERMALRINRINPVTYLNRFIEEKNKIPVVTEFSITRNYMRMYLKYISDNDEKLALELHETEKNPLMSQVFLSKFKILDSNQRMIFAKSYISSNGIKPLDALQILFGSKSTHGPLQKTQHVVLGGVNSRIPYKGDLAVEGIFHSYRKCTLMLREENVVLNPIKLPDEYYGEKIGDTGFYQALPSFYELMCKSIFKLSGMTVILDDKYGVILAKYIDGKIVQFEPAALQQLLGQIATGSIFFKLGPYVILNTPLYQIKEPAYYTELDAILNSWVDIPLWRKKASDYFMTQIRLLIVECKNLTLADYYYKFMLFFAPFIPLENNTIDYAIIDRLKHGYLDAETYGKLSLEEKIQELDVASFNDDLRRYVDVIAPIVIKAVSSDKPHYSLPNMVLTTTGTIHCSHHKLFYNDNVAYDPIEKKFFQLPAERKKVPGEIEGTIIVQGRKLYLNKNIKSSKEGKEVVYHIEPEQPPYQRVEALPAEQLFDKKYSEVYENYYNRDIVYDSEKGKCYALPEILTPDTKTLPSPAFMVRIKQIYGELADRRFELRDGTEYYINKDLYIAANKPRERVMPVELYRYEDVSKQFNEYFGLTDVYPEARKVISLLMDTKIAQVCQQCTAPVNNSVQSIIDRSDGSTIKISFCSYECMSGHKFRTEHTLDEITDEDVVSNIVGKV